MTPSSEDHTPVRSKLQEVGGTLIGEDGLVAMVGAESMQWYQVHQTHGHHLLHSSHYYEPSSSQQPPLI